MSQMKQEDFEDFDIDPDAGVTLHPKPTKPTRLRFPIIVLAGVSGVAILAVALTLAVTKQPVQGQNEDFTVAVSSPSYTSDDMLNQMPISYDQLPPPELPALPSPVQEEQPKPALSVSQDEKVAFEPRVVETSSEVWDAGMFFGGGNKVSNVSAPNHTVNGLAQNSAGDNTNIPNASSHSAGSSGAFVLSERIQDPVSPYEVKSGSTIPAALITAINSDLPGDVFAQVSTNVYDTVTGQYLLIPQGARLHGKYDSSIKQGQSRAMVLWKRIIFPNGKSIGLGGMGAADLSGASGVSDRVDNHFDRLAGGVLLSTVVGLGGNLAADDSDDSFGNDVGDSVAQEASRTGQRFVDRALNVEPTITIRGGTEIIVFVNKDIILEPYQGI